MSPGRRGRKGAGGAGQHSMNPKSGLEPASRRLGDGCRNHGRPLCRLFALEFPPHVARSMFPRRELWRRTERYCECGNQCQAAALSARQMATVNILLPFDHFGDEQGGRWSDISGMTGFTLRRPRGASVGQRPERGMRTRSRGQGCRFRQGTFAGTWGNGRDAPKAADRLCKNLLSSAT